MPRRLLDRWLAARRSACSETLPNAQQPLSLLFFLAELKGIRTKATPNKRMPNKTT
jgi:hypothetical protein